MSERDGYKQINVQQLLPVAVQAIKELRDQKDAEIAALKQDLKEDRAKLAAQQKLIEQLLKDVQELKAGKTAASKPSH